MTLMADHWTPLHNAFYDKAGGAEKLTIKGVLIENCAQGYLIDKKTADAHGITNMEQLKDPEIAKLFDTNGRRQGRSHRLPSGLGLRAGDRAPHGRLRPASDRHPQPG